MLGMFGLFGRSYDLQLLDRTMRAAGLHPRTVPDAVKLTTVKELKSAGGNSQPDPHAYEAAAALLAYCIMGPAAFSEENGIDRTGEAEKRLIAAMEDGQSLDARLVMLTMQARLIHSDVVARFHLEMG